MLWNDVLSSGMEFSHSVGPCEDRLSYTTQVLYNTRPLGTDLLSIAKSLSPVRASEARFIVVPGKVKAVLIDGRSDPGEVQCLANGVPPGHITLAPRRAPLRSTHTIQSEYDKFFRGLSSYHHHQVLTRTVTTPLHQVLGQAQPSFELQLQSAGTDSHQLSHFRYAFISHVTAHPSRQRLDCSGRFLQRVAFTAMVKPRWLHGGSVSNDGLRRNPTAPTLDRNGRIHMY